MYTDTDTSSAYYSFKSATSRKMKTSGGTRKYNQINLTHPIESSVIEFMFITR